MTLYRTVMTYARRAGTTVDELQYVVQPEGLVAPLNGVGGAQAWEYRYFKTDHTGSTRVVLAASGALSIGGFAGGAISGAAGEFAGAASGAWMSGANFGQGLKAGLIGGVAGGITGGLLRGLSAKSRGFDFWNGWKVTGEMLSVTSPSGQSYDAATLKQMSNQAKADAKYLWGAEPGKNGLIDISTTLDANATREGYTYGGGSFANSAGENVDGFMMGSDFGKSKVFLSPDVAASRTSGIFPYSGYGITDIAGGNVSITILSARYVNALGHELVHVNNWFATYNLRLDDTARRAYDENAAYTFSKSVYKGDPGMVQAIDDVLVNKGWNISHPSFTSSPIFR